MQQRPRAKKYRPRRRHFRHGLCAAAARAITAAKLYLEGKTTLREAAFGCGSNVTYVRAALLLLKAEDAQLFERVLHGHMALTTAAGRVRPVVELVRAYHECTDQHLAAAGRQIGPAKVWDHMISPVV